MDSSNIPIIGQKKKACVSCGKIHPFAKCRYEDLISMVAHLVQANQMIPGLIQANTEVTALANTFRTMAKDSAMAIIIAEKVVMKYENGPNIWKDFQETLEREWPKAITNQDTTETQDLSSPENTIQSETGSKPCTETILNGDPTAPDSSQLTNAAMHAEARQPLLTT